MATLERTWQHAWNQVPIDNTTNLKLSQSLLQFWKSLLKGAITLTNAGGTTIGSPSGLWTVAGSSDSSTAGMDAVDRLTDITKWVRATAGSPHSWIVLKGPTSGYGPAAPYVILDYSSTSDGSINIAISKAAPTGGSTTARPTATDERTHVANQQFNDGTNGAHHFHGLLSSLGDSLVMASKDGTGFFWFGWFHQLLANTHAGDTHPWVSVVEYTAAVNGIFSDNLMATEAGWRGWQADGVGATVIGGYRMVGAVTWNNLLPPTGDSFDASIPNGPIFVGIRSPTVSAKGRLVDIRTASGGSGGNPTGKVEPLAGTPQSVIAGGTWLPTNAAPTL
jgi:hypothetical protein